MKKTTPYNEFERPETIEDLHRPPGSPRPRETKSQKAQLESEHRHGTQKELKLGMAEKTGLAENLRPDRFHKC